MRLYTGYYNKLDSTIPIHLTCLSKHIISGASAHWYLSRGVWCVVCGVWWWWSVWWVIDCWNPLLLPLLPIAHCPLLRLSTHPTTHLPQHGRPGKRITIRLEGTVYIYTLYKQDHITLVTNLPLRGGIKWAGV